jgi:hypothetical protein
MAVTVVFYNPYKLKLLDGSAIDHDNDTFKMALASSSYTPNIDTHDFFDDITNEVAGTGYTAGGATLTNPAASQDSVNDRSEWDFDDVTWSTATITARYAIIYKSTGTDSTSPLIGYIDFGADQGVVGVDLKIALNAEGFLALT